MLIKCLVVGDGAVGKTSFMTKYCSGIFSMDYCPTINDTREKIILYKDKTIKISFNDIAGQENLNYYCKSVYDSEKYNIVLLMFALNERQTFRNITEKWIYEIESFHLTKKVILVGTKYDIRRNDVKDHISIIEGQELGKQLGVPYIECSSVTNYNIQKIVHKMLEIYFKQNNITSNKKSKRKKRCIIS